jgi:hypothetical protein
MSNEKMVALLKKLDEKTGRGEIDWEETSDPNCYRVVFTDYIVRIRKVTVEDSWGNLVRDYFTIEIVDDQGRIIDEAENKELEQFLENPYEVFKELYVAARRKALGADKALDEILSKLS